MAINKGMMSSTTDEWPTPQWLFDALNRKYGFTLDPCATADNAKCSRYYTKGQNGLLQEWGGENVFCNPPYGKVIGQWVEKAWRESQKPDTTVVMLLPARTDTRWFHEWIYGKTEITFLRGRLKFGDSKNAAPFPSMIVVFNNKLNNNENRPY